MPRRIKVGITLSEETLKKLEEMCFITGLDKSYAISMAINVYMTQSEEFKKLKKLKNER